MKKRFERWLAQRSRWASSTTWVQALERAYRAGFRAGRKQGLIEASFIAPFHIAPQRKKALKIYVD